jgi:hypothetical protein
MPRPQFDAVPDSDTEVVEELTTRNKTKRGIKLKTTRRVVEQPLQAKVEKASGSRRKNKKQTQAHRAEESIPDLGNNDMIQAYELVDDPEYQDEHVLEDAEPQGVVCL